MPEEGKMKKWKWLRDVAYFLALMLILISVVSVASAGGGDVIETYNLPDGVQVYEVDGHVCVSDMRGGLQCWCRGECDEPVSCAESLDSPLPTPIVPVETDVPGKTREPLDPTPTVPDVPPVSPTETPEPTRPTPGPTDTPVPTTTKIVPTDTPVVPTNTPELDKTKKPPCNQGIGNGAEGCDPGNSNNRNPSRDECGNKPPNHPCHRDD